MNGPAASAGKRLIHPPTPYPGVVIGEEYEQALDAAEIEAELDLLQDILTAYVADAGMKGGARRAYKQRGGGLKEAFAEMRRKWAEDTSSAVGSASSALGGALTAIAGTPIAAIKSAGLAAAASAVAYGPTVAPYLTTVLMDSIADVPSAVSTITVNAIQTIASTTQLIGVGAIGIGALAYFGICAGVVYKTNGLLFRGGHRIATEAVNIVAAVAGTTDEDALRLLRKAGEFLAAAKAPAAGPSTTYKYGIMVVSGPNAERLIRVMANTPAKLASVQRPDGSGGWVSAGLIQAAAGGAGGSLFGGSYRRRRSHRNKRKSRTSKKRHVNRKTRRS